jgi:predicted CXXCH cytochrome family protein
MFTLPSGLPSGGPTRAQPWLEVVVKFTSKHVFFLLLLVMAWGLPAAAAEHPVPLPKDVQDKNCLECHEDKTKGKAVHSAIQMGCSTCHSVKTEGEATTVELVAPKSELCFTCHEKSKEQVSHKPYEQGQCTTCHDPHTSDFAKQTRAEGNQLCLACHLDRRTTDTKVKLFGSQEISDAEFQQIPKISLDPSDKFGHPLGMHPVSDYANPATGEKISCLTCHNQHASPNESLIQVAYDKNKKPVDTCDACHLARDNAAMTAAEASVRKQEQEKLMQERMQQANKNKKNKKGSDQP